MSRQTILVVRPDRIGDVVLSTPVIQALKHYYPDSKITVLVQNTVRSILEGAPGVDEVLTYDPKGRHQGLDGLFTLIQEIRNGRFKIAISLQSEARIAAALYAARVPHRIGPLSKIHSYLFYNRGVRQQRSNVEMHEADYNMHLLRRLGIRARSRDFLPQIHISDALKQEAKIWIQSQGPAELPLVILHPGMGGSALNWPASHYADLVRRLLKEPVRVLITQGPQDFPFIREIKNQWIELFKEEWPSSVLFYNGEHEAGISFLGALMSHAKVVVAPSTGPLHVAAASGGRVVTMYPPIRVQSAVRWGPYVADDERASVMVPEVFCGQDFHCIGEDCVYFPCMRTIQVSQALDEVRKQLKV